MAIKQMSVTVNVNGAECTLTAEDFTNGGAAVWTDLPDKAANLARAAAKLLKESVPDLPNWPEQ